MNPRFNSMMKMSVIMEHLSAALQLVQKYQYKKAMVSEYIVFAFIKRQLLYNTLLAITFLMQEQNCCFFYNERAIYPVQYFLVDCNFIYFVFVFAYMDVAGTRISDLLFRPSLYRDWMSLQFEHSPLAPILHTEIRKPKYCHYLLWTMKPPLFFTMNRLVNSVNCIILNNGSVKTPMD